MIYANSHIGADDKTLAANAAEYGVLADHIRWVDDVGIQASQVRRARILHQLAPMLTLTAKQTKPHLGALSPGCRICAEGRWSCLFINGKCNCRCFYCPTVQNDISVPTTNRVPFATAADYAQYVRRLGFHGVSISGGEPFITFKRALSYIEAVRKSVGPQLHIWLYTNGTLVNRERLNALKAAGLNEIRFDISAVDYDLSKAESAAGIIDCVTVEIPAIPEDAPRLTALLPHMASAGIGYLNLHQLRLTPHNYDHLIKRPYTFLHGESVTVLESEMAALTLLQSSAEQGSVLPINYCSFVYKRRYQQAAARRRNAGDMAKEWESVTENGFIRALTFQADAHVLEPLTRMLAARDETRRQWSINTKGDRLMFHESLWPMIPFEAGALSASYSEAVLVPNISYRHTFKEIRLESGKKFYIEKRPVRIDLPINTAERLFFENRIISGARTSETIPSPDISTPGDMPAYEFIQPGLQDYF